MTDLPTASSDERVDTAAPARFGSSRVSSGQIGSVGRVKSYPGCSSDTNLNQVWVFLIGWTGFGLSEPIRFTGQTELATLWPNRLVSDLGWPGLKLIWGDPISLSSLLQLRNAGSLWYADATYMVGNASINLDQRWQRWPNFD